MTSQPSDSTTTGATRIKCRTFGWQKNEKKKSCDWAIVCEIIWLFTRTMISGLESKRRKLLGSADTMVGGSTSPANHSSFAELSGYGSRIEITIQLSAVVAMPTQDACERLKTTSHDYAPPRVMTVWGTFHSKKFITWSSRSIVNDMTTTTFIHFRSESNEMIMSTRRKKIGHLVKSRIPFLLCEARRRLIELVIK